MQYILPTGCHLGPLVTRPPFEIIFSKVVDYEHLCVFGCLAYAHRHDNDKFQARSYPCIFVSYPGGQKGYKLYDITDQKFFVFQYFSL